MWDRKNYFLASSKIQSRCYLRIIEYGNRSSNDLPEQYKLRVLKIAVGKQMAGTSSKLHYLLEIVKKF